MKYTTARKYLGELLIWEYTNPTSQLKSAIKGTLLCVDEGTVVGNKRVELQIKGIDEERYTWDAANARVVKEYKTGEDEDE